MPTVQKRVNGQLVETTEEAAKLQGVPLPTTPAGVAGVGGNPDMAKAAGTPNQKQPVIQEAVKPADSLQRAQRTEKPAEGASEAQQAATQKATELRTLGSLQTRVQSMIEDDLRKVAQTQLTGTQKLSEAQVGATSGVLTPEQQTQLQTLMGRVASNPQDQQALAEASEFARTVLGQDIANFSPQSFIAKAQEVLGGAAATQVRDTYTLEQLPLSAQEATSLTNVFGDTWKGLTAKQLGEKVEGLRQAEFSRVNALRAELATATGAHRQLLLRELASLGASGVAATEKGVADLSRQLAEADMVTIGGEEYKVEDLLRDDKISSLVTRMLGDPKLARAVAKSNPEFARWVSDNARGLEDLAKDVRQGQGTLRSTFQVKQDAKTVADGLELSDRLMKQIVPNWDKVEASAPNINVGFYQLLKDPATPAALRDQMAAALGSVETQPELIKSLAKLSPQEFQAAFEMANAVTEDTFGLLSKLSGVPDGTEFVTDPTAMAKVRKYKPIVSVLQANPEVMVDRHGLLPSLIESGQVTAANAQKLVEKPELLDSFKDYVTLSDQLKKAAGAKDMDAVLDAIYGKNIDLAEINAEYERAKKYGAYGDPDAKAKLDRFKTMDDNRDGKLDTKDSEGLAKFFLRSMSPESIRGRTGFSTFVDRGGVNMELREQLMSTAASSLRATPLSDAVDALKADGKVDLADLDKLAASGQLDQLYKLPAKELSKLGIPTRLDYEKHVQAGNLNKAKSTLAERLQRFGVSSGDLDAGGGVGSLQREANIWAQSPNQTNFDSAYALISEMAQSATDKAVKEYWTKAQTVMDQAKIKAAEIAAQQKKSAEEAAKNKIAAMFAQEQSTYSNNFKTANTAKWDTAMPKRPAQMNLIQSTRYDQIRQGFIDGTFNEAQARAMFDSKGMPKT